MEHSPSSEITPVDGKKNLGRWREFREDLSAIRKICERLEQWLLIPTILALIALGTASIALAKSVAVERRLLEHVEGQR